MSAPKKRIKDFPLGKPLQRDLIEHRSFYDWWRIEHSPRFTQSIYIPNFPLHGHVLTAHNKSKIGFTLHNDLVELIYLHPETTSWFHINLNGHHTIKDWREGAIDDDTFRFHRRNQQRLRYRLAYWRMNLPNLTEYLGCQSDLRLITRFTLALNYPVPAHETPENHSRQLDLPGIPIAP